MSEILLQIDGNEVKATEGMTILEAARSAGIAIPTLCHHEKLEPFGGCRLCIVEVEERGWTKLVVSSGNRRQGMLELQGMSSALPDRGAPGSFCFDQSAVPPIFFSFRFRGIRDL
jgi:ferredoxin